MEVGVGSAEDDFYSDGNAHTAAMASPDGALPSSAVPFRRRLPSLFLFERDIPEATGLALNSLARGAVAMSTIFLGPALLNLAKEAAGSSNDCNNDDGAGLCEDDEGRIYGMRPTSLLTNIGVFSGLLSSALTPLFGSIVDHTPHQKAIGEYSAITLSIVKGIEIFVGQSTWFLVSVLQVLNFIVYNAYLCAIYAYTAELSTCPNEQTGYNSRFQTVYYLSMLVFLVLVMAISTGLQTGDVGTARISQTVAFAACISIFAFSWRHFFRPRPALREVPAGSTLCRSGFEKLSHTASYVWNNPHWNAVRFFLLSVMLSESATAALSTISTTYMTHVLEMSAGEVGKVFLDPWKQAGRNGGDCVNPLRSALLCLVIFIVNTTTAAMVLTGPESKNAMYFFASIWGVCLSWLHPTHSSLYCTIMPRGQESELMGIYVFSGSILAWLPPLLFSFLNEIGASMSIGLASLNVFFAGGFVLLLMIGRFDDAVSLAQSEGMAWAPIGASSCREGGENKLASHPGLLT